MAVLEEGLNFPRPLGMNISWQYFHQHPDVWVNIFHGKMLTLRGEKKCCFLFYVEAFSFEC